MVVCIDVTPLVHRLCNVVSSVVSLCAVVSSAVS